VEVIFDIDANGIINVTAKDKATGKEQNITITASTNLNESDIDRMVKDARANEAEDKQRRELITAKNEADSLAYQTEKTLNDLGDKVPANEKTNIESQIKELRQAVESEDVAKIKSQSEALQNAFHALSQQLYAQQGSPQAGAPGGMPGGKPGQDFPNYGGNGSNGNGHNPKPDDEGEVVEGEFREA
jgi:molecular chaperone DnaK